MRRAVKRSSKRARIFWRDSSRTRLSIASAAAASLSTMKPVRPSSITSGTEPLR